MKHSAWWILPIVALVTACAGIPRDDSELSPLDRYMAYAGDPVDRFNFPQRIRSWSPVDREHLLIRVGPRGTYLLAVGGGCIGLQTTRSIGISSRVGSTTVTSGLDEIQLDHDRCRITEIRPVDADRMRADKQTAARQAPRDSY